MGRHPRLADDEPWPALLVLRDPEAAAPFRYAHRQGQSAVSVQRFGLDLLSCAADENDPALAFRPSVSRRTRRRVRRACAVEAAHTERPRPGRVAGISAATIVILVVANNVISFDPAGTDDPSRNALPSLASLLWPIALAVLTAASVLGLLISGAIASRLATARLLLRRHVLQYLDVSAAAAQSPAVAERLHRLEHTLKRLRGNNAIAEGWVPGVSDPTFADVEWSLTASLTATIEARRAIADAAQRPSLAILVAEQAAQIAAEDAAIDDTLDHLDGLANTAGDIQDQLHEMDLAVRLRSLDAESVAGLRARLVALGTDVAALAASANGARELLDAELRRIR